ncbi:MAG: ferritin family protein [archaeon]
MIQLFVCKICGEPYLGERSPADCPYCGAPRKYVKPYGEYSQLWKDAKLTSVEKENLTKALAAEVNAMYYYDKVAKTQEKYSKYNRFFKRISTVEQEHISTIVKFLNIPSPELKGEEPKGSIEKDIERTKQLEAEAVRDYTAFVTSSKHRPVKTLFKALLHAEQGHFDFLDKKQ